MSQAPQAPEDGSAAPWEAEGQSSHSLANQFPRCLLGAYLQMLREAQPASSSCPRQAPEVLSEEAGSSQAPGLAQFRGQRPVHLLGGELHALGGFHGPAQGPVEVLQVVEVKHQGVVATMGLLPGGPRLQLCHSVLAGVMGRQASWARD